MVNFNAYFLIFLLSLSGIVANAQLSTNANVSPSDLVQNNLLGSGVTASNITYSGDPIAIGSFNGSATNIGLGSGVIMTTGTVENSSGLFGAQEGPFGPNDEGGAGVDNGVGGDPQLDALSNATTMNAAVLEFDFVATGSVVSFNYVFASEEYLEYVNAGFNDAFGFFITGQNPAGGTYNSKNIAIVPGTNIPVTIDNLNDQSYGQYYVDNGDGNSAPQNSDPTVVQYDGFTTVLTASANVVCGNTYHIKLAIADAGDGSFDSGVFLESQSFSSPATMDVSTQVISPGNLGPNQILEGCGNANITFTRSDSLSHQQTFALSYAGVAVNGTDYSALPSTVTFAPGQSTATVSVQPIFDNHVEGNEPLSVTITYSGNCGQNQTETVDLEIVDQLELQVNLPSDTTLVCPGNGASIGVQATGGVAPYSYTWSNGATGSTITVNPNETTSYTVTITDACGNQTGQGTIVVTIPVYDQLTMTLGNDTAVSCPNTPVQLGANVSGGAGGYQYIWSTGSNATEINVQSMFTQTYTLTVIDQCGNSVTDDIKVEVLLSPLTTEPYGGITICPGETINIGVNAEGGAGNYTYQWSTMDITQDILVSPSATTTYYVEVMDDCGTYVVTDSVTVTISRPTAAFEYSPMDVVVDEGVHFQNTSVGAVSYHWVFGNGTTSSQENPVTIYTEEGEHTAMLIAYNQRGCADTTYHTFTVQPKLVFYVPNAFTPDGDGLNDVFIGQGVGVKIYQLRIFDRWGHVIFESTDERAAWDGTKEGTPLPPDVYVWQYQLRGYDREIFHRTGSVTLIR